jgi:integrase
VLTRGPDLGFQGAWATPPHPGAQKGGWIVGLAIVAHNAPALSEAGLAINTAKAHVAMLTLLKAAIVERKQEEAFLPDAIVIVFEWWRITKKWQWSTMARNMGTAIGAFAHLPLYTTQVHGMNLMSAPVFRRAVTAAERFSKTLEHPRTPIAATAQQVRDALPHAPDAATRILLILAWQTTMRLGDVAQLRRSDVATGPDVNASDRGLALRVTFHNSKTINTGGDPHSVHTFLPREWEPMFLDFISRFPPAASLFPVPTPRPKQTVIEAAVAALKKVNTELEARSLRRGALQTLATKGASHAQLLQFSGHKTIASLLRYLNWGAVVGKRETEMQELGSLLAPTA